MDLNLISHKMCGGCENIDGLVYTSYPPKVRCTIDGEFKNMDDFCSISETKEGDNSMSDNVQSQEQDNQVIQNKKMIVVNLFGSPGTGKSTGAAYIFSKLKMAGINAELALEYAKDKVWEESVEVFKNQAYIFGKQYFRLSRVNGKVEVVITDSPILLSAFYNNQAELGENFNNMCLDVFHSFNNYNVFLKRVKPYNPAGRFQTEEESDALVQPMKDMLDKFNITCKEYDGNQDGYDKIVQDILYLLNLRTKME